jgi:hypothetical protein
MGKDLEENDRPVVVYSKSYTGISLRTVENNGNLGEESWRLG